MIIKQILIWKIADKNLALVKLSGTWEKKQ
jgi:hypothetical protein